MERVAALEDVTERGSLNDWSVKNINVPLGQETLYGDKRPSGHHGVDPRQHYGVRNFDARTTLEILQKLQDIGTALRIHGTALDGDEDMV